MLTPVLLSLLSVPMTQLPTTAQVRVPAAAGVVLVILDDVGRDMLADAAGHTPCLDELAARGLTFREFYAAQACSPCRAMIASGAYAHRAENLTGQVVQPHHGEAWSLPTAGVLLGRVPSSSVVGKWHLGTPSRLDHPRECGAAEWWGTQFNLGGSGTYYGGDAVHNGQPTTWEGYITWETARRTVQRIAAGDSLVWVGLHAVHKPIEAPPPDAHTFGDLSTADDYTIALAMLEAADRAIGEIAQAARAAGYVLIVVSDNGTSGIIGGDKGSLLEGGVRTWMMVEGPGVRHGETRQLVQAVDVYSTVCELVNGAPPTDRPDSISFAPLLYASTCGERDYLFAEEFKPNGAPPAAHDRVIRDERWKLWALADGTLRLYDLESDPDEQLDLLADGVTGDEQATVDRLWGMLP